MADREKVIKAIDICLGHGKCDDCGYRIKGSYSTMDCRKPMMRDAITLLKEQEQIKSPDEFKSLLLGMFDSIWDVEIDHPVFQDTVGELMEGVLQAYRQAVKWE